MNPYLQGPLDPLPPTYPIDPSPPVLGRLYMSLRDQFYAQTGVTQCCQMPWSLTPSVGISLTFACRSDGWPWGQYGIACEISPKKRKITSRQKCSSSPVSRTTVHTSPAVPEEEISEPPSKHAKRAEGVGATQVIKGRPGRQGDHKHETQHETEHESVLAVLSLHCISTTAGDICHQSLVASCIACHMVHRQLGTYITDQQAVQDEVLSVKRMAQVSLWLNMQPVQAVFSAHRPACCTAKQHFPICTFPCDTALLLQRK